MDGKYQQWQRLKKEQEEADVIQCTFSPKLRQQPAGMLDSYVPIHERVGELQKKKNERLARSRLESEV